MNLIPVEASLKSLFESLWNNLPRRAVWIVHARTVISAACVFAFLFFLACNEGRAESNPVLESARGTVLVRNAGSVLWARAEKGLALEPGDTIKTRAHASVIVRYPGGAFFKAGPQSEVTVDRIVENSGRESAVVSVSKGKAWISASEEEEMDRLIVEMPGGVADVGKGTVFAEVDEYGRESCLDVFSGEANIKSPAAPGAVRKLETEQRVFLEKGYAPAAPTVFSDEFDTAKDEYSCLASRKKTGTKQLLTAEDKESGGEYVIVVQAQATVEFAGKDEGVKILGFKETAQEWEERIITARATVTFYEPEQQLEFAASQCLEIGQSCISDDNCCSSICTDGLCATVSEAQMVEVIVTKNINVTFDCSAAPEFSEIKAGGAAPEEGKTLEITGKECESSAEFSVDWKVKPLCGSISSMTLGVGEQSADMGTVPEGETGTFSVDLALSTEEPVPIKLTATDRFNNQKTFTFSLKFKKHESLTEPPVISSVVYSGSEISEGQTTDATITSCEEGQFTINGQAAARCGEIASVSVSQDGSALSVSGQEEWSAQHNVEAAESTSKFSVTAKDSNGLESEPFEFSISFNVDESLLEPPTISSVTYDGAQVSDGGSLTATVDSCGTLEKTITGQVETPCGNITEVSLSRDGNPVDVSGDAEWSAVDTVSMSDAQSAEFAITAVNSSGRDSAPFTFEVTYEVDETLLEPPTIDSVVYGDTDVYEGDVVTVTVESCDPVEKTITGSASTPCGEITEVTVVKDISELLVSGTSGWSAADSVSYSDVQSSDISIYAEDTDGEKGPAFEFSVEVETNIPPPAVSMESIGGEAIEDMFTVVSLYRDSLEGGELLLRGTADSESCSIDTVEVSVDDGGSWEEAEGTSSWMYSFAPYEGTMYIQARAKDSAGTVSDPGMPLEVEYTYNTLEDELLDIFEQLARAYQDEDTSTFVDLTSADFTSNYEGIADLNELETSLDNKFTAYDDIYLSYSVDTYTVTGETGRVGFRWNTDQSVSGYPNYGVFVFIREEQTWKFYTVEDDDTFLRYTSQVGSITLSSAVTELPADGNSTASISAEVRDSANNLVSDGTQIFFETDLGSITISSLTLAGSAMATFTTSAYSTGTASIYAESGDVTSNTLSIEIYSELAPLPPD